MYSPPQHRYRISKQRDAKTTSKELKSGSIQRAKRVGLSQQNQRRRKPSQKQKSKRELVKMPQAQGGGFSPQRRRAGGTSERGESPTTQSIGVFSPIPLNEAVAV
ncbi:hypothetical protein DOE51_06585 [Bdellovibrio sp. NC01]|nr:hypothetical protein DOE51_06585 [Bdellovibrio sp. NC01]